MIVQLDSLNTQQNPIGLTDSKLEAILNPAGSSQHGRENPSRYVCNTPLTLARHFLARPCRAYFIMAGCLGMVRPWSPTISRLSHNPLNPPPDTVRSIGGGYSSLDMESPK